MPSHPEVALDLALALAGTTARLGYVAPESANSVPETRKWFEDWAAVIAKDAPDFGLEIADHKLRLDGLDIRIRRYRPKAPQGRILFVHGGAWTFGSLATHDHICRWLSHSSGHEVVSLEHACAPENPYPAAVEQTRHLLEAIVAQCSQDGLKLLVAGDSAGASIAAVAILDNVHLAPKVSAFISIYGAFVPDLDLPSYSLFADGRFGSRSNMRQYWEFYRGGLPRDQRHQLTPISRNMARFPPTLSVVAQCDLMRDDGVFFHHEIVRSGGTSQLTEWMGLTHGCLHFVGLVPSVTRAAQSVLKFIQGLQG